MGDAVLDGASADEALREHAACGACGAHRAGLDDLLRQVRERRRELRERGRLDGTLEEARALLDTAIGQERAELFPDPSDDARMREAELDTLPATPAQAIRRSRTTSGGPRGTADLRTAAGHCCAARCSTASSAA